MNDIFKELNNSKIDFDKYEEIELDEKEKEEITDRLRIKIDFKKSKKSNYKKFTAIASIFVVSIGIVLFSNQKILAYVQTHMGSLMELFSGDEISKYKSDAAVTCENNGIKITLKDFMLDINSLYYTVEIDMDDFDFSQIIGEDNLNVKKMGIFTQNPVTITLGKYEFCSLKQSGLSKDENNKGNKKIMTSVNELTSITNADSSEVDALDFNLFDIIDGDNVVLKLNLDKLDFSLNTDGLSEEEINRMPITRKNTDIVEWDSNYSGTIKGNWKFETHIDISAIKKSLEAYDINKEYTFDYKGFNGNFTIDKVYKNEFFIYVQGEYLVDGDKSREECEKVTPVIRINDLENLSPEKNIDISLNKRFNSNKGTCYKYSYKYNIYGMDIDEIELNPGLNFNSGLYQKDFDIEKYSSINVNKGFLKNIQNSLKNMLNK